jgi:hypothetical protein
MKKPDIFTIYAENIQSLGLLEIFGNAFRNDYGERRQEAHSTSVTLQPGDSGDRPIGGSTVRQCNATRRV